MDFIVLIDKALMVINTEINEEENRIYKERYLKMINYLERLKEAFKMGKINKKNLCLSIVRMLDHGDSERLQDVISEVNHYYQENIYEE